VSPAVIVGGGISGLAAAFELQQRGVPFLLVEGTPRLGGLIRTDRVDGFVIDAGPDALIAQKPAGLALCHDLGIADRLRSPLSSATSIVRGGRLRPLPPGAALGIPTSIPAFAASSAFSLPGKTRMAAELLVPPRRPVPDDESIASFMGRRFGREAVDYLADPLLAGIHGGDAARLSMRLLFPRLLEAEATSGSVIRALRKLRAGGHRGASPFVSFPRGMAELVEAIVTRLPAASLRTGTRVAQLDRQRDGWMVTLASGERIATASVFLATPPRVSAPLLERIDWELAARLASLAASSVVTIALGYRHAQVAHPLDGTGFVVPRREKATVSAVSWVSSKWAGRAPEGSVLLRAYVGGTRDPEAIDRPEDALIAGARRDLQALMGIAAEPVFARVYRWRESSTQLLVGHAERAREITVRAAAVPGLYLSAAGIRGSGVADCVGDARAQAAALAEQKGSDPGV
jgi:oxygen-dependent protoporphyrinogen oxidase